MRKATAAVCLLALAALRGTAVGAENRVPEPLGYRLDAYRSPVPATIAGGRAIGTDEARALWEKRQAIFIDVLPAPRRPGNLPTDALWKPLPHRDVPGSLWLPDVGRGRLAARLEEYFRDNLAQATKGEQSASIVLYCLADCWMSWNATKRAASYGYTRLFWYRDGMTGWEAAHLPTAEAQPVPGWP